jgi:hypothetical protein
LNFLDFVKQQPEFWKGAASILDTVLTKGIDNIDKQKNVTYISAVAKMYNHLVEEFGITQVNDDNIMLKDTPVKYRGYTL